MRSCLLVTLLLYPLMFGLANADGIGDIAGRWRTVRHGALVDIVDCGNATPCGLLAEAHDADFEGNTHDIRNRNPTLRSRPLLGLPILWGFEPADFGWQGGWVYNPEDGKTFRAYLRLISINELRVTGCIGPLCRSQIWTRTPN